MTRGRGRRQHVRWTDQVAIGASAAEYLHKLYPDGARLLNRGASRFLPTRQADSRFTETVKKYRQPEAGREPAW